MPLPSNDHDGQTINKFEKLFCGKFGPSVCRHGVWVDMKLAKSASGERRQTEAMMNVVFKNLSRQQPL